MTEIKEGAYRFSMDATGRWELIHDQPTNLPTYTYAKGLVRTREEKLALADFLIKVASVILAK